MSFDVIIVSNGPGELSTWVMPVVEQISASLPEARVIVALVPCPYASGEETNIASKIPGVAYVLNPSETSRFTLTKKLPEKFSFQKKGIVIHLGGDQFFTVMIGWKTKFPMIAYTENHLHWPNIIDRYLLLDQNLYAEARLRGIKPGRLSIAGNLMIDAVSSKMSSGEIRERLALSNSEYVVSLLPGSKPFKVKYATPFLLRIADEIAKKNPQVQFIISQSPYTPLHQIVGSVTNPECIKALDGVSARFGRTVDGNVLVTEKGTMIRIVPQNFHYESFQVSDVALTLPGTNTAELAILGVPMVTLMPLNNPDQIPLEGFWGRIADLPVLGKYLKRFLVKRIAKKIKFISIGNHQAGQLITPEFSGNISPEAVADQVNELLENQLERREISLKLRNVMGQKGAAKNIVNNLIDVLLNNYRDLEIFEVSNNFPHRIRRESDSE